MTAASVSLSGLALISFLSATILPMSSEAVLAALVLAKSAPTWLIVAIAGTANTAGSCVNWLLGLFVERFRHHKWFPVSPAQMTRAQAFYNRWGWPSLLLSWVPLIGDPLTLVAGLMRVPFWLFLPLVAFAKFARYGALVWIIS